MTAAYLPFGVVVLDERTAARLAVLARAAVRARPAGTAVDPDVRNALAALEAAERALANRRLRAQPRRLRELDGAGCAAPALVASVSADTLQGEVTRQVARRAGCSEQAVRKAAGNGQLAGRRFDGVWRFRPSDVDAWLARRSTRARAGQAEAD